MRIGRLALYVCCIALSGLCLGGCNDQPTVSAQPKPALTAAVDLKGQPWNASPEEIQRRCGAAAIVHHKKTTYTTESAELWYPSKSVELMTAQITMGDPLWTFAGGYKSMNPNDERHYTHKQLAKLMPCLKDWTDAEAKADHDLGVPEP